MFVCTGSGVITVDAPATLGNALLPAIKEVTDEPVTHVVYSHHHADHIGAGSIFGPDVTIVAHDKTCECSSVSLTRTGPCRRRLSPPTALWTSTVSSWSYRTRAKTTVRGIYSSMCRDRGCSRRSISSFQGGASFGVATLRKTSEAGYRPTIRDLGVRLQCDRMRARKPLGHKRRRANLTRVRQRYGQLRHRGA